MKNITLIIYTTLLICFTCHFGYAQHQDSKASEYNLLWKIEKEGVANKGYLFGTMHVSDDRAFQFPDSVMLAIDESEVFALEVHPDTIMKATLERVLKRDTTNYYKELLSEDEYNRFLENFNKNSGLDFESLENKHPLNVQNFNNSYQGEQNRNTFIDMYLYGVARTMDKDIIGLEPMENQFQFIFDIKIDEARQGLKTNSLKESIFMDQLIESYGTGNLDNIEDILGSDFAEIPIMVTRNKDMSESIMNTLQNKSLFSAVGAGHLLGESSIISILEANGYKVTKVGAKFTGIADQYEPDPSLLPWEIMVDIKGGIQLNFPKDYNTLDQRTPYPTELGNDTLDVSIKIHTDLVGNRNYLIAYNDFPLGYYLESRETLYTELEELTRNQGSTIDSYEDIVQDGHEGRMYRITIQEQYKAILHIFVRGNRVYKFLNQNLTANEEVVEEDKLINRGQ